MNIPLTREAMGQTAFADYLGEWLDALAPMPLEKLLREAQDPRRVAIFCVDLINGFCYEGQLESSRVRAIIGPVVELMSSAHAQGVRNFVLTQDNHPPDSVEFRDYPVHCVRGTSETETVRELADLPFAHSFTVLPKTTISSSVGTVLDAWLDAHPDVTHRIVVGDCTDLCVYQLAMHLKLRANAANQGLPVIVPADCVDTYDVPLEVARSMGIPAHPGDFYHRAFLYHMSLNGIQIVGSLA
jgi:nicotinamidase-related amidase